VTLLLVGVDRRAPQLVRDEEQDEDAQGDEGAPD